MCPFQWLLHRLWYYLQMLMLIKKQKRCSEIVLLAIGSFPVLMLYFAKMYFLFLIFILVTIKGHIYALSL